MISIIYKRKRCVKIDLRGVNNDQRDPCSSRPALWSNPSRDDSQNACTILDGNVYHEISSIPNTRYELSNQTKSNPCRSFRLPRLDSDIPGEMFVNNSLYQSTDLASHNAETDVDAPATCQYPVYAVLENPAEMDQSASSSRNKNVVSDATTSGNNYESIDGSDMPHFGRDRVRHTGLPMPNSSQNLDDHASGSASYFSGDSSLADNSEWLSSNVGSLYSAVDKGGTGGKGLNLL